MNYNKSSLALLQDEKKFYPYPVIKEELKIDEDSLEKLLNELIEEYDAKL